VHVPGALREQVWQVVDAGPGSSQACSRRGGSARPDVVGAGPGRGMLKRSFRFAGLCALAMSVIVIGATLLADSVVVEADGRGPASSRDGRYVGHDGLCIPGCHRSWKHRA